MNKQVSMNFAKVNLWHLGVTIGIFCLIVGMLRIFGWSEPEVYPQIQKDIFLAINSLWSNVPSLAHNLTQLGDASVAFALLLVLFIAPKLWEALIASSLLSLVLSALFKTIYAMPRPARAFENTFNIIGERLAGTNSLPSGHSITIFTILSVLLFAFMPSTRKWRLPFIIGITLLGVFVGLSRVGVGAHYPLDVLVGASLGCVCGVFGVLVASKTRIFAWLDSHFGLLIFATLGAVAVVMAIQNISKYNLAVFYLALICALGCLFMILHKYFTSAQRLDLQCTIQPPPSQSIVFIFVISALQVAFFHFPFLGFVWVNLTLDSINAIVLFVSLVLFLFALTTLMPLLLALISFNLTKIWFAITSITNAIAVYFVSVYGVFLDKTMMGNLFNTNPAEAGEFLSLKMALFIIILGILPACFLLFEKVARPTRKSLAKSLGLIFFTLIVLAGVNFQNLLWFDKYSKQLGALIMPWSYIG
ncbi:phosphoethanolamine transferase domain-containing protein, partial [Helicobacter typhlonius]